MRISPKKLLHGLLYMAPVFLLTLAACGGGGGGSTSTPSAGPFTLGGSITGLNGSGLVLQNNGGSDLTVASGVTSYTFASSVPKDSSYNVTVLTHPSSPTQLCSITGGSGTASADVTTANVACVNAYTISGTIYGDPTLGAGIGPILQNNGGDNSFIPSLPASGVGVAFNFSIPVADGQTYAVTQLARAKSPGQNCAPNASASSVKATGTIAGANVNNVSIYCVSAPIVPKYAYAANNLANTVSGYTINPSSGALTQIDLNGASAGMDIATGSGPYSVTVDPTGHFAYVANTGTDTLSAYSINVSTGALTLLTDVNAGIAGNQTSIATGDFPISITIHPSGKFAYTVNQGGGGGTGNTISAYSINASGALAAIDADGATGTQASIATGTTPYAITVDPLGKFAYVANNASNTVSAYTIDPITGALTSAGAAVAAGTNPSSIAIDPKGKCALVTNSASDDVKSYLINQISGVLSGVSTVASGSTGSAPRSVAVDPNTGLYAYVANSGGSVSAFSVNSSTCVIASIDTDAVTGGVNATILAGGAPLSINVDPSGLFVYVANLASDNVSVYSIGAGGALTPGTSATAATGNGPVSVTTTE